MNDVKKSELPIVRFLLQLMRDEKKLEAMEPASQHKRRWR